MNRARLLAIGIGVLILSLSTSLATWAQEDEPDYEATIAALETRVSELESELSEGQVPTPSSSPISGSPGAGGMAETEAIQIDSNFVVLYYYFVYDDGELAVYGEMQNVSATTQVAPNIRFTFFDANGNSYGDDQANPVSHWVEAGGRMPFDWFSLLGGAVAPGDWETVEVSAGDPASDFYVYDTSMLSIEGAPLEGPSESVSGRILNSGTAPVTGVSIYVAYFDEQGAFVGSCTGFRPPSDAIIPPGGGVRFEAGGGGCGTTDTAITGRNSQGPFSQRLILARFE
jgi:hypothetical protein